MPNKRKKKKKKKKKGSDIKSSRPIENFLSDYRVLSDYESSEKFGRLAEDESRNNGENGCDFFDDITKSFLIRKTQ